MVQGKSFHQTHYNT